jgi:AraC-like DNA-binding protein
VVTSRLFRSDPLYRLRVRVEAHVQPERVTVIDDPAMTLYRFTRPTPLVKTATFGVTLGVVFSGAKTIRIGNRSLDVDPRRLVVVTREVAYSSLPCVASPDEPFVGLGVAFAPERVARALLALADAGGPSIPEPLPAFSLPTEAPLVDAIERLLGTLDDPLDRKLIAPLVLDELLFRLLRSDAAAAVRAGVGPPQDATRILDAMQLIRVDPARKLTVATLARAVAMSPSHFAHRFTAVARMSPMRYVREVRLERARGLLCEHGARTGEVASRVGFESAAHFTREFRRRYGEAPSQYRLRATR